MVILVVFKGFLLVKNLEILIQIVLDRSIYYYLNSLFKHKKQPQTKIIYFLNLIFNYLLYEQSRALYK